MKRNIALLVLGLLLASAGAASGLTFGTGDVQFDATLERINAEARVDVGSFTAEMSIEYGVSERKLESLLVDIRMEPAEVYIALELSALTKKPVDTVVSVYQANRTRGWGVVARELGIRPGSPEFHALKQKAEGKAEKKLNRGKKKA